MSDFHRASLIMAWLRLCRITNKSTETENCYQSLNRELRWLWNSVYINWTLSEHLRSIYIYIYILNIKNPALQCSKKMMNETVVVVQL